MARPVPADLEDALAATPAARERFWSLPPDQVDAWVAWVERARLPGARRRRIGQAVQRLGGRPRAVAAVETDGAGPAVLPPGDAWWAWLLGLALLAVLAALIVWLGFYRNHRGSAKPVTVVAAAKTSVPHVVGIRVQAAEFQLRQAKLTAAVVRHAARRPKGIVLGQKPRSGARVPKGTQVVLLVSAGQPGVKVPSVVGLPAADAARQLRALKLAVVLRRVPAQKPAGTVLAQAPRAGTRARPGAKVALEVAKRRASVSVPDLTGQSEQTAVSALARAGLKARVAQVPSSQPSGTVVAQSPAAGGALPQGSAVRLNVSRGPAPTTTAAAGTTAGPRGNDYTGMRLSAAVQRIAAGRQQVIVVDVASSRPAGVVVANSTAGSRERLQVSAGPSPAPAASVPDVTGESASQAVADLRTAGFPVLQVQWPVSDPAQNGVVTYETPAGGGRAPHGATVVIYVGSSS